MDLRAVTDAVQAAACSSDADAAGRILLVYIAPGDGGLYIYRPGCGLHQLGGAEDRRDFASSMHDALRKIWPEASKKTLQWLRIAADFLARSPIAKRLGASVGDEDDE